MLEINVEKVINDWSLIRLNNGSMDIAFLDYGCIITEINVEDKMGVKENIILSYEDLTDYQENPYYFGAVIGRVAGRIKNSTLTINQTVYELESNQDKHHLHGGTNSLHNRIWHYELIENDNLIGVIFTTISKNLENGYPGNLKISVEYTLNNDNEFCIQYHANSDGLTPVALTNHSYFNLSGNIKETIANHKISMSTNAYLALDNELIATHIENIRDGDAFDFRKERKFNDVLKQKKRQQFVTNNGYDHYFIFEQTKAPKIELKHEDSGRKMTITTNEPGVVMYTANELTNNHLFEHVVGKENLAICFETQASPATLWLDNLPTILLEKNKPYERFTKFIFEKMDH